MTVDTYRLWYRTYTEELAPIVDSPAYTSYLVARDAADIIVTLEAQRPDQYIKEVKVQHVQCGEMVEYCECDYEA